MLFTEVSYSLLLIASAAMDWERDLILARRAWGSISSLSSCSN